MKEIEIIESPNVKRKVKIEKGILHRLLNQVKEEVQVIVHCTYTGTMCDKIRIWKSTFLYSKNSSHRSKLVHAENITLYPIWMNVDKGQTSNFTLIFTGLPKSCKMFDMIENIPESGGFVIKNIERNNSDIYRIEIN